MSFNQYILPTRDAESLIRILLLPETDRRAACDDWLARLSEDKLSAENDAFLSSLYPIFNDLHPDHPLVKSYRSVHLGSSIRAELQKGLWAQLVKRLIDEGVSPLILKGASLVGTYYKNATERPMADIDIYISKADRLGTHDILLSLGWQPVSSVVDYRDTRFEHAAPYQYKALNYAGVDVHAHIMSKYLNDEIDQWYLERTESFNYAGFEVKRLNPTALLTHTLLHGLRWEEDRSVKWVLDALRIYRQRACDVDWPAILDFARQNQLFDRLRIGLFYLHGELRIDIPQEVISQLNQYKPGLFERFENNYLLTPPPNSLSGYRSILKLGYFIIWRSMRMGNRWLFPANLIRVILHMIGNNSDKGVIRRLYRYMIRNKPLRK